MTTDEARKKAEEIIRAYMSREANGPDYDGAINAIAAALAEAARVPLGRDTAGELPFVLFKDGTLYCAVRLDFINLQESNAGFGPTMGEACCNLKLTERAAEKARSKA